MDNLQKIVVLCVVVIVVVGGLYMNSSYQAGRVLTDSDTAEDTTQIDPPSLELDAGPSDTDIEPLPQIEEPQEDEQIPSPTNTDENLPTPDATKPIACTQEAKMCEDGSFVGRTGPNCEFATCPEVPEEEEPITHVFDIKGFNFAFDVGEITVKEWDTVTINFESADGFHDWVVDEFDAATDQVQTGGKTSVTFVADKTGEYEYYCSVGSHRAKGMVGILTIE